MKIVIRLIAIEVTSLEDVYWLEDSRANQILGKDFAAWNIVSLIYFQHRKSEQLIIVILIRLAKSCQLPKLSWKF